jgi:hypothetical protein
MYAGNTEGRPSTSASQASYLAGFLDGDGSIHFQLVRQKEYKFGFYIRASCLSHRALRLDGTWSASRSSWAQGT